MRRAQKKGCIHTTAEPQGFGCKAQGVCGSEAYSFIHEGPKPRSTPLIVPDNDAGGPQGFECKAQGVCGSEAYSFIREGPQTPQQRRNRAPVAFLLVGV